MEAVSSVTVAVQAPIDPYRFNMFMSDLLAERGSDIKQMHGVLSIQVNLAILFIPPLPKQCSCLLQHTTAHVPATLELYNILLQALLPVSSALTTCLPQPLYPLHIFSEHKHSAACSWQCVLYCRATATMGHTSSLRVPSRLSGLVPLWELQQTAQSPSQGTSSLQRCNTTPSQYCIHNA